MVNDAQMPELLPCPFCGGPAEVVDIDEGENAGGSCVCCTTCLASGNVEFGFKENFVSIWNQRVQSPAPDAVARLVRHADRFLPVFLATSARNIDFDGPWDDFDLSGGLRAVIAAMETSND